MRKYVAYFLTTEVSKGSLGSSKVASKAEFGDGYGKLFLGFVKFC